MSTPFVDRNADPAIHGFIHQPARANGDAIVLTHGAGANCDSKLLLEMAAAFAASGFRVLRFDLPFRTMHPHGPPGPGSALKDRQGLRRAVAVMREMMRETTKGRVFLGGHSYGGRQTTILASEEPGLFDGLLLLSYPLHPPRKPAELRTSHFPKLATPAFFVHGTRDPFGAIAEMQSALKLIPAPHALYEVDGAGHELLSPKITAELPARVATEFQLFLK
ncbi:MAG TPA: alpha/beta fold hydrolase [Candidatus Acidoferrum sp.]|jgi:hypothetical protein|nr:alpha/beta fold hydrolase [Candidatus Acidoferrum sp.]